LASLEHPCKFQRLSRLGSVTARHSSSGRQSKSAALNRGRHLYSAGRPSGWALAHISSLLFSSANRSGRRLYHKLPNREFVVPQQISTGFAFCLCYCSDVPHRRQPHCTAFGRLLAGTLCVHFLELLPLTEFCPMQNSLCVQVLCCPILPAVLHGTRRAAAVSQTLWRGTRNGITELSQRTPPMFGWATITLSIGPHFSPT